MLASDELRQPEQVVGGAVEDEEPVDLGQTSQLYLGKWAGLLEPAEGCLDQPATAEADRIAGVPDGSSIAVRAAALVALLHKRGDVEGAGSGDEVLQRRRPCRHRL